MNIQTNTPRNTLHPVQNQENLEALAKLTKSAWDRFQETDIPWVLKLKPYNHYIVQTLGPIWIVICLGIVSCYLIATGDLAISGSHSNLILNPLYTILGGILLAIYCGYDSHYLLNLAEGKLFSVKCWGNNKSTEEVLDLGEAYCLALDPEALMEHKRIVWDYGLSFIDQSGKKIRVIGGPDADDYDSSIAHGELLAQAAGLEFVTGQEMSYLRIDQKPSGPKLSYGLPKLGSKGFKIALFCIFGPILALFLMAQ